MADKFETKINEMRKLINSAGTIALSVREVMGYKLADEMRLHLSNAMSVLDIYDRNAAIEFVTDQGDGLYMAYDAQGEHIASFDLTVTKAIQLLKDTGARMVDNETIKQIIADNAAPAESCEPAEDAPAELPEWQIRIKRTEFIYQSAVVTVKAHSLDEAKEAAQVAYANGEYDGTEFKEDSSEYGESDYLDATL